MRPSSKGRESAWWPTICGALGEPYYLRGETDDADRLVRAGGPFGHRESESGDVSALAYRSVIAGEQGPVASRCCFRTRL